MQTSILKGKKIKLPKITFHAVFCLTNCQYMFTKSSSSRPHTQNWLIRQLCWRAWNIFPETEHLESASELSDMKETF